MKGELVTAEQLKEAAREYAERAFPGTWQSASVVISRGVDERPEVLVVTREDAASAS